MVEHSTRYQYAGRIVAKGMVTSMHRCLLQSASIFDRSFTARYFYSQFDNLAPVNGSVIPHKKFPSRKSWLKDYKRHECYHSLTFTFSSSSSCFENSFHLLCRPFIGPSKRRQESLAAKYKESKLRGNGYWIRQEKILANFVGDRFRKSKYNK